MVGFYFFGHLADGRLVEGGAGFDGQRPSEVDGSKSWISMKGLLVEKCFDNDDSTIGMPILLLSSLEQTGFAKKNPYLCFW